MKNNDNKIINIIFRVVIIGAFFMGIRTIYNFYVLMITYKGIKSVGLTCFHIRRRYV